MSSKLDLPKRQRRRLSRRPLKQKERELKQKLRLRESRKNKSARGRELMLKEKPRD